MSLLHPTKYKTIRSLSLIFAVLLLLSIFSPYILGQSSDTHRADVMLLLGLGLLILLNIVVAREHSEVSKTKIYWMVIGSILLYVFSPYVLIEKLPILDHPSIYNPISILLFVGLIGTAFIGIGSILLLPFLYIALSWLIGHRNHLRVLFSIITLLMLLDLSWFIVGWPTGMWQQKHLTIIAIENILCFLTFYTLIFLGNRYKNTHLIHLATLLFFFSLYLVMFPWVGESI